MRVFLFRAPFVGGELRGSRGLHPDSLSQKTLTHSISFMEDEFVRCSKNKNIVFHRTQSVAHFHQRCGEGGNGEGAGARAQDRRRVRKNVKNISEILGVFLFFSRDVLKGEI